MSEKINYENDPRTSCKYGAKCFRKNPAHHEKYKHPPKRAVEHKKHNEHPSKKPKFEKETKHDVKISNDISDSEDDDINKAEKPVTVVKNDNKEFKRETSVSVVNDDEEDTEKTKRDTEHKNEHPSKKPKFEKETKHDVKISNDISDSEDDTKKATNENKETSVAIVKDDNREDRTEKTAPVIKDNNREVVKEEKNIKSRDPNIRTGKDFDKNFFIKTNFLVEMPDDFYDFWEFCKSLNEKEPSKALKDVDLFLVGPFDVLADKFCDIIEPEPDEYLIHWRYYYDIPEFQTIIKGDDSTGYHIGYFRDDPNEKPAFVASNCAKKDGEISCMGDNIFAAVYLYLEDLKKKGNPFKKMYVGKFQSLIKSKAQELQLNLSVITSKIQERNSKIVTRCFNKAGLVVPYNRKTQVGYRELSLPSKELKSLLQQFKNATPEKKIKIKTELEEVFRWATIAIDECDFGTGIELGWNLMFSGIDEFNLVAARFLTTSYRFLNREAFAKIAENHMKNRKRGSKLSIIL